jgi:hypothetical protein
MKKFNIKMLRQMAESDAQLQKIERQDEVVVGEFSSEESSTVKPKLRPRNESLRHFVREVVKQCDCRKAKANFYSEWTTRNRYIKPYRQKVMAESRPKED